MDDLISRQDAKLKVARVIWEDGDSCYDFHDKCVDCLDDVPSAQPEPLTDKEQRIFLAAMGREEKVCKQVDEEWRDCREPYEDSLVRTCHEITRKVKDALWTWSDDSFVVGRKGVINDKNSARADQ